MKDFYTNDPRNLHQKVSEKKLTKNQKRKEIIQNLTECIEAENRKTGQGNMELMKKLQERIDILKSKK
jgi:hypothetical protein